jgi:acetyl-CoA C-acetyltransferase
VKVRVSPKIMAGEVRVSDDVAVIIGVGEASERLDSADWAGLSPADLAGRAAAAAIADARAGAPLAPQIDVIAAVRQFETSGPRVVAPFGRSDNFPRAVARRIGADPARAVLEPVGGQGPQHLVNEFSQVIARGEASMVLLCGAEAISTVRDLASRGESRDWSEETGGQLEDRGYGEALVSGDLGRHGARTPISLYAMFENARRSHRGLDREAYRLEMGRLFAPFTRAAAANPHAMAQDVQTPEALATVSEKNRITSDPFPRRVVARDQTNQGAAVLLASRARALSLGVPEERMIYLHGGSDVRERLPMERQDLAASPASVRAVRQALDVAGLTLDEVDIFDFYSCFPIAVFNATDALGIARDDPRPLTVTGGLPFFGGAGNNYSMHAIAEMVRRLRAAPEKVGLVTANGGFMSKYSVGVYSRRPAPAPAIDDAALQAQIDAWPSPPLAEDAGEGEIETYTIDYSRQPAPVAIVVARRADGARFVAMAGADQAAIVQAMAAGEPLGGRVAASLDAEGRAVLTRFEGS